VHSPFYPFLVRLDAGVAIFFVLAGFLLFRPYFAEHVDGIRAPSFGRYGFRRVLRIVPGYWVALSVLALLGWVQLGSWWEPYTLTQAYDTTQWFAGIHAAWSLSAEVAFYSALPLLVIALRGERAQSRTGRLWSGVWLVGFLWVIGVAFRVAYHGIDGSFTSTWLSTLPGMIDWFAIGMGLAVASVALAQSARRPRALSLLENHPGISWALAAGLFVLASEGLGASGRWGAVDTASASLAMHILYGLVALFVVLPAAFPGSGRKPLHRVLSNRVAAGLGLISYGIFLYNGPIVVWLGGWHLLYGKPFVGLLLLTLAFTLPAAALSYWFVERPVLWLKDLRLAPRRAGVSSRLGETQTPVA
jgi:peptidoglycan/LPS O-acetylase OafA/YrhL